MCLAIESLLPQFFIPLFELLSSAPSFSPEQLPLAVLVVEALLLTDSFSFCLSGNVLIYPLILKDFLLDM